MRIQATVWAVTIDEAFGNLRHSFPTTAEFQGVHFAYAVNETAGGASVLLEIRKRGRNYYWLLVDNRFKLVGASALSRFKRMKTVGETFSPGACHD